MGMWWGWGETIRTRKPLIYTKARSQTPDAQCASGGLTVATGIRFGETHSAITKSVRCVCGGLIKERTRSRGRKRRLTSKSRRPPTNDDEFTSDLLGGCLPRLVSPEFHHKTEPKPKPMSSSTRLIQKITHALNELIHERDEAIQSCERYRRWGDKPHGRTASGRPAPRLEFEHVGDPDWSNAVCYYWLVLPLREHDIRRELDDKKPYSEWYVPMGKTTRRGGSPDRAPVWDGKVETPFRDGAHAGFDREALGLPELPVWAVCGVEASEVMMKRANVKTEATAGASPESSTANQKP